MRRRAAAVTADRPGRLPVPSSRDEISRLAVTLNDMLARLQAAFEHERRFVADASHELRTPLALLQTELELALRRPRSREELEEALRSAADETQRLTAARRGPAPDRAGRPGALPIRPEPVAAAEVLEVVAGRFATRAASLGRELRVEPSQALLEADPVRVEQALGNLVDNALEYGAGAGRAAVAVPATGVELHVRDDGPGFPEDFRERAFDRFSRADEARSHGGSGLGLSIVELIARAHGGSAGLRNRAEGGADVWIEVPRAGGSGVRAPRADRRRRARADARSFGSHCALLHLGPWDRDGSRRPRRATRRSRRLRRLTLLATAVGTALAGAFAALAANAVPGRKTAGATTRAAARRRRRQPAPAAAEAAPQHDDAAPATLRPRRRRRLRSGRRRRRRPRRPRRPPPPAPAPAPPPPSSSRAARDRLRLLSRARHDRGRRRRRAGGGSPPRSAAVERELAAVDAACSRFREDSELSRVNAAAGSAVRVGPVLLEALRAALRAAAATGGLVDPTVGRSLRLAGYDRTLHRRRRAATRHGFARPLRARARRLVRRARRGALDACACRRASSSTSARPRRRSPPTAPRPPPRGAAGCGVLVSLGGDVALAGEPPRGGWPVRIADDHAAALDGPGPRRRARRRRARELRHRRPPLARRRRRAAPRPRPPHRPARRRRRGAR